MKTTDSVATTRVAMPGFVERFQCDHVPVKLRRGWLYPVVYAGKALKDKTSYVEALMRDGCHLNGVHVMPIGVETFATLTLAAGMGLGIVLNERTAG